MEIKFGFKTEGLSLQPIVNKSKQTRKKNFISMYLS